MSDTFFRIDIFAINLYVIVFLIYSYVPKNPIVPVKMQRARTVRARKMECLGRISHLGELRELNAYEKE